MPCGSPVSTWVLRSIPLEKKATHGPPSACAWTTPDISSLGRWRALPRPTTSRPAGASGRCAGGVGTRPDTPSTARPARHERPPKAHESWSSCVSTGDSTCPILIAVTIDTGRASAIRQGAPAARPMASEPGSGSRSRFVHGANRSLSMLADPIRCAAGLRHGLRARCACRSIHCCMMLAALAPARCCAVHAGFRLRALLRALPGQPNFYVDRQAIYLFVGALFMAASRAVLDYARLRHSQGGDLCAADLLDPRGARGEAMRQGGSAGDRRCSSFLQASSPARRSCWIPCAARRSGVSPYRRASRASARTPPPRGDGGGARARDARDRRARPRLGVGSRWWRSRAADCRRFAAGTSLAAAAARCWRSAPSSLALSARGGAGEPVRTCSSRCQVARLIVLHPDLGRPGDQGKGIEDPRTRPPLPARRSRRSRSLGQKTGLGPLLVQAIEPSFGARSADRGFAASRRGVRVSSAPLWRSRCSRC